MCVMAAVKESGFSITQVVCGCAMGIDLAGYSWARCEKIPVEFYPAWDGQVEWAQREQYPEEAVIFPSVAGKAAGPARNRVMAMNAEALIAVWDGKSPGTKNMIDEATKRGLKVHVSRTDK